MLITFFTILFTSLLAYSTVYGRDDLANNIGFIKTEGEVLGERVGSWFQYLFWFVGAFSLYAAALGIVDGQRPPGLATIVELQREANQQSRRIHRQKHDRQQR